MELKETKRNNILFIIYIVVIIHLGVAEHAAVALKDVFEAVLFSQRVRLFLLLIFFDVLKET